MRSTLQRNPSYAPPSRQAARRGSEPSTFPSLGVSIAAGQTLYLRVYPYNISGAASGKSLMLGNVVVSAVTN